jgi:hypothetical protein
MPAGVATIGMAREGTTNAIAEAMDNELNCFMLTVVFYKA